jgi:hypothetical protein
MPISCTPAKDTPPAPEHRTCCMLTGVIHDIVEEAEVTSYRFGGGRTGVMYTCNGGFIDFGHVLDNIDMTFYYYHFLTKGAANVAGKTIPVLGGGKVTIKKTIPSADRPTTAASIAFDQSVFYEIMTYWIPGAGKHNSGFSPEDLVSNYTGVRIAERALKVTGKKFDAAVTEELKTVLPLLLPRTRAQTTAALTAISGVWVTDAFSRSALFDEDYLRRRNVNFSPISPCFVSAPGIGCTGTPAYPSVLGTSFPTSIRDNYDAEYDVSSPSARARIGTKVTRGSFGTLIAAIRADTPSVGTLCP